MRATCVHLLLVMATFTTALHAQRAVPDSADEQALKERLLTLTDERLRSAGLFVDRSRARLGVSGPVPATGALEVRPLWSSGGETPPLPLSFELRPASGEPARATLVVPLLRDVWVAKRRLGKGSAVSCADLNVQRRDIRQLPTLTLAMPCDLAAGTVALRDIGARDVLRSVEVGAAPAVMAGSPVHLKVQTAGISVTASAVALLDAQVGEQVDVRLQGPARTLKARVIGPGRVQLLEASQ